MEAVGKVTLKVVLEKKAHGASKMERLSAASTCVFQISL